MENLQQLEDILKNSGYSITIPRKTVFTCLYDQKPQSMHNIVEALGGKIDRASIYRTVQLFERLNIVHRIHIGWKYKVELSDTFHHHHHHITCIGCNKVISIKDELLEDRIGAIAAKNNILPTSHQIEIRGYCSECKK